MSTRSGGLSHKDQKDFGTDNPNLSTPHIVLLSMIFTILQNVSVSKLSHVKPTVMIIAFGGVAVTLYYLLSQSPLTMDLFRKKSRLVLVSIQQSTESFKFDVWISMICILIFGWIVSIWKNFISMALWMIVVWIYNLKEGGSDDPNGMSPELLLNSGPYFNLLSGSCVENTLYSTDVNKTQSYSSSMRYINLLEKKINVLSKKVEELENHNLEQNIRLYTFNHNLTDKLNNLEKALFDKSQAFHNGLNAVQSALDALKRRKETRIAIARMYIKPIIMWMLPNPVIAALRFQKNTFFAASEKVRAFWN